MANPYFQFKQFTVHHDQCAMKVTTDGCLFGAWCAEELSRKRNEHTAPLFTMLDIGTGTGLLSLMVAQKVDAIIKAVEIDGGAATQATANVAASPFQERITVLESDIMEITGKQYDVILSNPPFYENELRSGSLAKDTAHHSHQLTWAQLFVAINQLLAPEGIFFLLLPYKRAADLEAYVQKNKLYVNKIVRVAQSTHHAPFRLLIQGSRTAMPLVEEHLSIRDAQQQYTPEFTDLLKDYYLYL